MEHSGVNLTQIEDLLKKSVQLDHSFARVHLDLGDIYSQEPWDASAIV